VTTNHRFIVDERVYRSDKGFLNAYDELLESLLTKETWQVVGNYLLFTPPAITLEINAAFIVERAEVVKRIALVGYRPRKLDILDMNYYTEIAAMLSGRSSGELLALKKTQYGDKPFCIESVTLEPDLVVKYRSSELCALLADGYLIQLVQSRLLKQPPKRTIIKIPTLKLFRDRIGRLVNYCNHLGIKGVEPLLKLALTPVDRHTPAHLIRAEYYEKLRKAGLMQALDGVRATLKYQTVEELREWYETMLTEEVKLRDSRINSEVSPKEAFWFLARFHLRKQLRRMKAGFLQDIEFRVERRKRQLNKEGYT